jgi:maleate cis-trans isomerase
MAIEERFGRLARIRLHKARIRLRQVHAEEVDLLPDAADHADRFAKIHLAMPG